MMSALCVASLTLGGCAIDASGSRLALEQPTGMAATGDESETARRARIRLELGASYYQQGNYNVALEEVRQAIAIAPDLAAAHGMLGLIHMDLGERQRAEDSFQRALRIAPTDSELNNNYGWFLCRTGRARESIERFNQALRNPLYTTPARPLHNAGICALRLGDEQSAEQYFQRSFQIDPRNPVAMYNLAEIYLKRRDLARARFHAQRLVEGFEPSAQLLWLAIRVERAAGQRDAAAKHELQLRRQFPASSEAALLASGSYGD